MNVMMIRFKGPVGKPARYDAIVQHGRDARHPSGIRRRLPAARTAARPRLGPRARSRRQKCEMKTYEARTTLNLYQGFHGHGESCRGEAQKANLGILSRTAPTAVARQIKEQGYSHLQALDLCAKAPASDVGDHRYPNRVER